MIDLLEQSAVDLKSIRTDRLGTEGKVKVFRGTTISSVLLKLLQWLFACWGSYVFTYLSVSIKDIFLLIPASWDQKQTDYSLISNFLIKKLCF